MKFNPRIACALGTLCLCGCFPALAQDYARRPEQVTLPPLSPIVIANRGQFDASVRFAIAGPEGSVMCEMDGMLLVRKIGGTAPPSKDSAIPSDIRDAVAERRSPIPRVETETVRIEFRDPNPDAKIEGLDEQSASARYTVGNESSKWITEVPTFKGVVYRDLWPGVAVTIKVDGDKITFEAEGSDLTCARMQSAGEDLALEAVGGMLSKTLGGGWPLEKGSRVTYDPRNNAFLAGTLYANGVDSFIARIDSPGKLAWISLLGGRNDDIADGISVGRSGVIYVTGLTRSEDFPTTRGAFNTEHNGSQDFFTARLNDDGALAYSSYLGLGGGWLGTEPFAANGSDKLLAIMVDDGREVEQVRPLLDLGIPLTFAVMPWATPECIGAIRSAGCAVFLHAPMEALGSANYRSEEITVGMTEAEVKELLESWMVLVTNEVGISNHRGSAVTSDPETMKSVLSVAKKHDLMFYDSNTAPVAIGVNVARAMNVPCLQQDLFLDDREVSGVRERVLAMAEIADRTGYSTCICHVGGTAVPAALKILIPELKARGFRFVTVPELYEALNSGVRGQESE